LFFQPAWSERGKEKLLGYNTWVVLKGEGIQKNGPHRLDQTFNLRQKGGGKAKARTTGLPPL